METPEKAPDMRLSSLPAYDEDDRGLKSHRVANLPEELTPTPASKVRGRTGAGDLETPQPTPSPAAQTSQEDGTGGGGVTSYIKSFLIGSPEDKQAESNEKGEKVTQIGALPDGSHGVVKTSVDSSAVPDSLAQTSPQPVGVAKTELKEPASKFASALESIAGPPEAPDPSKKFGPALEPLTSEAPTSGIAGTVVGAVSAAAGTAVETIKQATGFGVSGEESTGPSEASRAEAGAVTAADLPKLGVVTAHEDGTAEIKPATPPPTAAVPSTVTPADLPEAGVVTAHGDGTAEISPAYEGASSGVSGVEPPREIAAGKHNSKPPVSAFAGANGNEGVQQTEIKEESAPKGAKPEPSKPRGDSKAQGAGATTEEEKAKSSTCGCCVIS